MSGFAAVVLAAGRSSRYRAAGGAEPTKLVARFRGEPLVRHVVRAACAAPVAPVIVVTGHAPAEVEAALDGFETIRVHNPDYARGLAGSLVAGLAAVPKTCAGAIVLLGDMPLVTARIIETIVEAAGGLEPADAVIPVVQGERGNPVLIGHSLFARAADLKGDEGARKLLRDPTLTIREIAIDEPALQLDIDDPGALARLDDP